MNTLEFAKEIPPEKLALIFKDFFEEHMAAYYMLAGVDFVSINEVSMDKASIIYSVKVLNPDQKEKLVENLQRNSTALNIYGHTIVPEIYLNGDLLCISITKNK
jgi:hypothetical protein